MKLFNFITIRILQSLPLALMVIALNFFLLKSAPGDMADVIAGEAGAASPEFMTMLRSQFGEDQPLYTQFVHYLKNVVTLDLGWSFRYNDSVINLISERLVATIVLMGSALVLAVILGALLGVVSAFTRRKWLSQTIGAIATLGYAMPTFWLALMIIVVFTIWLGVLPSSGMVEMGANYTGFAYLLDLGKHMLMPVGCLTFSYLAIYIRLMRDSVREVALLDFVRTARAKGGSRDRLIWQHITPYALLPVVTMTGLQFGALLSGSVTIETVFSWPGLGQLALSAVASRDVNLLLGILFISSLFVVVINLITELVLAWLDPRIETGGR